MYSQRLTAWLPVTTFWINRFIFTCFDFFFSVNVLLFRGKSGVFAGPACAGPWVLWRVIRPPRTLIGLQVRTLRSAGQPSHTTLLSWGKKWMSVNFYFGLRSTAISSLALLNAFGKASALMLIFQVSNKKQYIIHSHIMQTWRTCLSSMVAITDLKTY